MITYDLLCICGFRFEGWFKDRTDFYRQKEKNLLTCPFCEGSEISKRFSLVNVQTRSKHGPENTDLQMSEKLAQQLVQGLQEYVKNNFEDVGAQFATEALKIHFGIEKRRNIRGATTADEEEMLAKEGVEIMKFPFPAEAKKENEN